MKKQKGKIFLILVLLLVIVGIVVFLVVTKNKNEDNVEQGEVVGSLDGIPNEEFAQYNDEGVKVNNSEQFKKEKTFDGFKFSNISLSMINAETTFKAVVTNNSDEDVKECKTFDIIFLDKEQNEFIRLGGIIGSLKKGESTEVFLESSLDYSNAYDFKVVMSK